MDLQFAASTHIGRRQNNEDAHCVEPELGLFAVADGMGGYEGGEIASRLTICALTDFIRRNAGDDDVTWPFALDPALTLTENMVAIAVRSAHTQLCRQRIGLLDKMGSTVAALLVRDRQVVIGHVGDSRVYRLRQGQLSQLTRDHSLYAELEASGAALPPRAQFPMTNVITRAIGADEARPDVSSLAVEAGDVYLLCTDGLSELVEPARLAVQLGALAPAEACRALVQEAFERGGRDNITAVVVKVGRQGG